MAIPIADNENTEPDLEAVQPYSMHVSARYLDLTKRKLEIARLPRELDLPPERQWESAGPPKAVLEPLVDFWLEKYDWRAQESVFNVILPQFRTSFNLEKPETKTDADLELGNSRSVRVHFVHKRSSRSDAIPLLFCHGWPGSIIELSKMIDALTEPVKAEDASQSQPSEIAFHVVAPSIPGFGFGDASTQDEFGLSDTADLFDQVMKRLGYNEYVVHGNDWGFKIARAVALQHSGNCLAVHTTNPDIPPPAMRSPVAYIKHFIARLTKARIPQLKFGYKPTDFNPSTVVPSTIPSVTTETGQRTSGSSTRANPASSTFPNSLLYTSRPQTLAYSLCDSPVGLLSMMLDLLHPSPTPAWSPTDLLNWTMMQWLPGPEAGLRWLRQASKDSKPSSPLWRQWSNIPLGISTFSEACDANPSPVYATAIQRVAWVKRHDNVAVKCPVWETPEQVVVDMREFVASLDEVRAKFQATPPVVDGVANASA